MHSSLDEHLYEINYVNHNDDKGAFTLTLFEMTITDCPGFHVPSCTITIIKFWTSNFCHIKKITLNHALLKLSHER
jgi:hypothetical protein